MTVQGGTPWRVQGRALALLIFLVTALRLAVAAKMPLSADEAYYRVWSHALAPGYLDHPPMVALWIRLGTMLAGDTPLGVRLLGPLAAALGTLLLVQAGQDLAPGTAMGRRAAWLLNATLLLNAGAVVMTPDTPLLLFWTAALACIARLIRTGDGRWWLGAGAAAGLALDSKYTAVLLAPSLLAWIVMVPAARRWLRAWQPYAAAALALALFAPVLTWNAAHGWASFVRQGGRAGDFHAAQAARFMAELVLGQVGLATPLLFLVFVLGVAACARRGPQGAGWRQPGPGLLVAVTAVPALVFAQHALGDRVQGNWPGVLYPGAALAAAMAAAMGGRRWTGAALQGWAVGLGCVIAGLVLAQAAVAPAVLPRRADFTLIRLGGWDSLAADIEQARARAGAGFIVADEYGLAAELAFRLASPVLGAEPRWALFALPASHPEGAGLLVRSNRRSGPPDPAIWPDAVVVGTVARARAGVVAETYTLYRVGAPRRGPCVLLPQRGAAG